MPNYYNDQKQLVATDTDELLLYFNSLPDVVAYEIVVTLPCAATAILNVSGSGLPKFLYLGSPIPKNKIYPKLLPSNTINLDGLCNGIDGSNTLAAPDCGAVVCYTYTFIAPDCGTVIFVSGYAENVILTPNSGAGWAIYGPIKSTVDIDGNVSINVSVINTGYTSPHPFGMEQLFTMSANGRPNNTFTYEVLHHPNMPDGSVMEISNTGTARYTGDQTSVSSAGLVIEIFNINYNKNN